jgi:hypothetical protein
MTLPGAVVPAPSGIVGFDTDGIVTPEAAAAFASDGYGFCIRYLSRAEAQGATDLTTSEALDILQAGLALSAVQHPRFPGWTPSRPLGSQDGSRAAQHALGIGFPHGLNIWCDLEGVVASTAPQIVIDYCNAWFDAVSSSGYIPGVYVGSDAILDSDSLYEQLKFSHYWKSLSQVPDIAVRGYQMVQQDEHVAHGLSVDDNVTQIDRLGGAVMWLAPRPPGVITLEDG